MDLTFAYNIPEGHFFEIPEGAGGFSFVPVRWLIQGMKS
ncbi:hypothetical protein OOU_Y34scaffold00654g32 [Pyricularia oryzae Y34]|uniref:Uncharacterized protein n=3 Tax=Pyricularia oryzae TaxID=318829 RepID=A0A4P7NF27_PYROR|nr:hypothetical protein OOU_Y34scaffold00654g32 [Pyricularia oryzae Y34]QBZ60477.1 hypothetical protein PoMZ_07418 [Pyricularia oryzae]